jgi:acyl carrier protein
MEFSEAEKIIAEFFIEREGEGIVDELKTINLTKEGIIDSLDIILLATYLEEKFGKEIDITDDNTLKAFSNFENIVKLVL